MWKLLEFTHARAFLAKISWNCYYLSESEQRVDLTKYKNSLKTNFIGAETVKIADFETLDI